MIYLHLFLSFLQIGLFSFGGGYAAMPLIQDQVVTLNHWLSMKEFTDLVTISQMTPGPIAINSATFVGIKIAGIPGAVAATFGCILPSCIIVTIIARLYLKYRNMAALQSVLSTLRPAVVALIASAGISILISAFWPEGSTLALPTGFWSCFSSSVFSYFRNGRQIRSLSWYFPAFSMQVFLCLSNKTNGRSVFDLPFYHSFLNFNQQSFFPSLNAFPTASPSAV